MRNIDIAAFQDTCVAVLDDVLNRAEAVVVTRHGVPIVRIEPAPAPLTTRRRLGGLAHMAQINGDLIAPAIDPDEWEVLRETR